LINHNDSGQLIITWIVLGLLELGPDGSGKPFGENAFFAQAETRPKEALYGWRKKHFGTKACSVQPDSEKNSECEYKKITRKLEEIFGLSALI
jgi:hypothetical protein